MGHSHLMYTSDVMAEDVPNLITVRIAQHSLSHPKSISLAHSPDPCVPLPQMDLEGSLAEKVALQRRVAEAEAAAEAQRAQEARLAAAVDQYRADCDDLTQQLSGSQV